MLVLVTGGVERILGARQRGGLEDEEVPLEDDIIAAGDVRVRWA